MNKNRELTEQSESVALKALCYLTTDQKRAYSFFTITGFDADNIRNVAQHDGFFACILKYLLENERLLIDFCTQNNINPMNIKKYYSILPGGEYLE